MGITNYMGSGRLSNLILSEVFNPLTKLENTYNKNTGTKLYGKVELQYDLLKDLKLSTRFGYTKYDGNAKGFTPLVFYGPLNVENSLNADGSTVAGKHNMVSHEKTSNFNYTWESFANYHFTVKEDHNFETVVGLSIARISGNAAGASREDVPFNSWEFADFTAATGTNTSTNPNALKGYYYQYFRNNISYFGRMNYDYQDKYLASFTARREGSIAFGDNNKFANFYSGSLGWAVTRENFFNVKAIDYLKIPIQTLKVGALGTHNCLGLAKAKGARILVASTSEVYGDPLVHPQTEEYWGNVNPVGPRGVYDEAKRFMESITMAYHTFIS